jgi:CRISPR system Cascade subunit CasE
MIDTETQTLHMLQLYLDPRRLVQLGKMQGLLLHQTDTNYLVHCALGELFGDTAPKPFYVDDDPRTVRDTAQNGRHVRVLGYADDDHRMLREEAKLSPNPTIGNLCDWDRFDSQEMPSSIREGRRLQFELRACPVVRKSSKGVGQNAAGKTRRWEAGDELDAFLSRAWENPDEELNRENVYKEWLERQFESRGGAELETAGMIRFSIERMTRRTQGNDRKVKTIKRPDVTLTGTLTVTDSDDFQQLLRSGIGRHKSFGFGMLKIRRA